MMRKWFILLLLLPLCTVAHAESEVTQILLQNGTPLTEVCTQVSVGDIYIAADNQSYEIVSVDGQSAIAQERGAITLPDISWLDADEPVQVSAMARRIALYCTHSDESYEPTDGYYSTTDRGSIYDVANALAADLSRRGIDTTVAETLHHPHDAGAYRRSRQTAVQLIRETVPDCLLDIHRDGIPNPDSYTVTISGKAASKVRLLVGRGNQNADVNKDFALMIKAVGDRIYPGLIKDIYLGKGAFNQDLLPRALLLECGTYTIGKDRVLASMPMMADVISRALYGGVLGSAGRTFTDVQDAPEVTAPVTMGQPDAPAAEPRRSSLTNGLLFLAALIVIGVVVVAFMSAGSMKRGSRKLGRTISEMTGGLIGKSPRDDEDPHHS